METYDIIKIDDFRTEFIVGDDTYFLQLLPGSDYNGFKTNVIQFGLLTNNNDPYEVSLNKPLREVNKILNTIGTQLTDHAKSHRLRYLIFNPVNEGRDSGIPAFDTVRSRMFMRWLNQNLPNNPTFVDKGLVCTDYSFLLTNLDDFQKTSLKISWVEDCPGLYKEFVDIAEPLYCKYKFNVREKERLEPVEHFFYYPPYIYTLTNEGTTFTLTLGDESFVFTTTEELETILLNSTH